MWQNYRTVVETALRGVSEERVLQAVEVLRRARHMKAGVYIMGNGGSAATASHFANDLFKVCALRAFALPDMTSVMLAYGNDYGWESMFSGLLRRVLSPNDVVVAISCSGDSPNVVSAVNMIRDHRIPDVKVVVLTGHNYSCRLSKLSPDVLVHVPFNDIRVQEDCHIVICHAIVGALDNAPPEAVSVLQSA